MEEQTKKRNTWWIIGLIALAIIGAVVIYLWVSSIFGPAEPEGPPIEVPPPSEPSGPSATALDDINIRSGPGTQYPSYGVAPKGTTGEVIGVSGTRQWWVVKLSPSVDPSGQGWVSGQYVQVSNADNVTRPAAATRSCTSSTSYCIAVCSSLGCNIYSQRTRGNVSCLWACTERGNR